MSQFADFEYMEWKRALIVALLRQNEQDIAVAAVFSAVAALHALSATGRECGAD